jgi:hypothetical protein
MVCRLHLDLRKSAHPNSNVTWSLPTHLIGSFPVASRSLHEAVMAEFGDPAVTMEHDISPVEFPSQTEGTYTTGAW